MIGSGKICPIFCISNATGEGVQNLRIFMSKLTSKHVYTKEDEFAKFEVESKYFNKDVGLILCGNVVKGNIKLGQTLMFGPDKNGNFKQV